MKLFSRHTRILSALLAAATLLIVLPVPRAAASGPSDWARAGIASAAEAGLIADGAVADYGAPITREQFCGLAVRLYTALSGRSPVVGRDPFDDTDNPDVLAAYRLGICRGVSDSLFGPDVSITRQEMCVMLVRCIDKAVDGADITYFEPRNFYDSGVIADWAIFAVCYAFDKGIITGTGDMGGAEGVVVDPLREVAYEEAIIMVNRIYAGADGLVRFRLPDGHKYDYSVAATDILPDEYSVYSSGYMPAWKAPGRGYIFREGSGLAIVHVAEKGLVVENYSVRMKRTASREIPFELPIFGAAYLGSDDKFYVLTGRANLEQQSGAEVMRLTRYSRNWRREAAVSVASSHSIVRVPFDAGCPRIADDGNTLAVYTSRERYTAPGGLNHQSNLLVKIDMKNMAVISQSEEFPWNHVSHSFDQYVMYDDKISDYVYVDHGDAYPRSLVLQTEKGGGGARFSFIAGPMGQNYTGVSIGGAALSSDGYLVAGNSVDQEAFETDKTRDIALFAISRSDLSSETTWLTDLGDGRTAGIPKLVKMGDDRMAVMWEEFAITPEGGGYMTSYDDTKYVITDGAGNPQGEAVSLPGLRLADNVDPIYWRDRIVWYTLDLYGAIEADEDGYLLGISDAPSKAELRLHMLTVY